MTFSALVYPTDPSLAASPRRLATISLTTLFTTPMRGGAAVARVHLRYARRPPKDVSSMDMAIARWLGVPDA